jgi:hypothetical protein
MEQTFEREDKYFKITISHGSLWFQDIFYIKIISIFNKKNPITLSDMLVS